MLAGEPPFTGQTAAAVIAKRLGSPTPQVRVVRNGVPESVDRALQTAMQRSPADRFASVTQFVEALRTDVVAVRPTMPRRAAIAAVGVLALAAAGWWAIQGSRIKGDLDPDVIAVMPFRVGGDPSIAYLRESMLDLLNARLPGGTGPRIVEPRTALSAWRREVGNEQEDLSEEAFPPARRAARRRARPARQRHRHADRVDAHWLPDPRDRREGAGQRRRLGDARQRGGAGQSPRGPAPQPGSRRVARAVRRPGVHLTRGAAGVSRGPAGVPPWRLFRGAGPYGRAFTLDSNFAQAAFGLVITNPLVGTVVTTAGFKAIPALWRLRDRLSPRDLALLRGMTFVGPTIPIRPPMPRSSRRRRPPRPMHRTARSIGSCWASGSTITAPSPASPTGRAGRPMRWTVPSRSTRLSRRRCGSGCTSRSSSGTARRSRGWCTCSIPEPTPAPANIPYCGQPRPRWETAPGRCAGGTGSRRRRWCSSPSSARRTHCRWPMPAGRTRRCGGKARRYRSGARHNWGNTPSRSPRVESSIPGTDSWGAGARGTRPVWSGKRSSSPSIDPRRSRGWAR